MSESCLSKLNGGRYSPHALEIRHSNNLKLIPINHLQYALFQQHSELTLSLYFYLFTTLFNVGWTIVNKNLANKANKNLAKTNTD